MTNHELELCDANPEWTLVLQAYQLAQQSTEKGWVPRVAGVTDVPVERLSSIHGKLIALGMLRFELAGRTEGVVYQVTPLGRQAVLPPAERQIIPEWMLSEEAA